MTEYARQDVLNALEQVAQYGTAPKGYASMLDVGTAPFIEYFDREVLQGLLGGGGATCKIVAGPYGSGKTHLLDLLHEVALNRGLAVVRTDLSQALGLEDWRILTRHILENIEATVGRATVRSLSGVLTAMTRVGSVEPGMLFGAPLPHPGFVRAMTIAVTDDRLRPGAAELLGQYLGGEPIPAKEFVSYGIRGIKNPLSTRNAESVLRTVVAGLHRLGLPGVLLLFDENEKTFNIPRGHVPTRVSAGANLLRRLIDATAGGQVPGLAVVMTVLPTFVDTCAAAYAALGQRLQLHRAGNDGAWRWPYLGIEAIAPEMPPEAFVQQLSGRLTLLVQQQGVRKPALSKAMSTRGLDVLGHHAGQDYRRYVSKALALIALKELEQ